MNYLEPYEYEPECSSCEELEHKLDNIKHWFSFLVEQLFDEDKYNRILTENAVDEICGSLGIKTPPGQIQLNTREVVQIRRWNLTVGQIANMKGIK